ncbi:unnamed protein product [Vitrella brassicaformis CCMP3155]|uniref:Transmembrane protein n=2 Tax=Vitrella brassicaformis TaxID=1169539 RepID=A0A0G4E958_VITBC|nr:unnamed protein product [Vitrella brassicaformis CCMP3155]|mmetsp:Transcript_8462/g.20786  ORF Transcript_8462/g.20786 Transcript_8462/m.20786 type:complete len:304 (+) Transcript_8462:138-1049(+)|eukprot:CEL92090.1 unnamed protein product [Vitrella brassicaformis CCMP3155]
MQSYKKMEEAQPEDEEAGLMMDNGTQPVGANGTHPRPPHMEMDRAPLFGPFVVADASLASDNAPREDYSCVTRCVTVSQALASLSGVLVGILAVSLHPELMQVNPWVFWYIIATLLLEILLLLVAGVCVLCLRVTLGRRAVVYSAAVCGLWVNYIGGVSSWVSAGFGVYIIVYHLNTPLPLLAEIYLCLEVGLSLFLSAQCCEIASKIVGYLIHKLEAKLSRRPEVTFQSMELPVYYTNLRQVDQALSSMEHPTRSPRLPKGGEAGTKRERERGGGVAAPEAGGSAVAVAADGAEGKGEQPSV